MCCQILSCLTLKPVRNNQCNFDWTTWNFERTDFFVFTQTETWVRCSVGGSGLINVQHAFAVAYPDLESLKLKWGPCFPGVPFWVTWASAVTTEWFPGWDPAYYEDCCWAHTSDHIMHGHPKAQANSRPSLKLAETRWWGYFLLLRSTASYCFPQGF